MTEELLRQGIAAAREGRKAEALRILMQVTELDDRNERAWLWLSQVVDSAEDRIVCLENVLTINPANENARAGLAWLAQHAAPSARPTPAPSAPGPGAEACPRCGHPVPLSQNECAQCGLPMIVICPRCRGHVEVARATCPTCQFSLGDFRDGAHYHLARAQAYLGHGKSDLVPEALARAHKEAGRDPKVLVRIAELYAETGAAAAALPALEEAAAVASGDAELQARIGFLYQRLGQQEQARAAFERSVQIGGDPLALLELARIEIAAGRAAEARALLNQVTKAKPLNAEAYLLLGDLERAVGNEDEAIRLYEHASQLTGRETAVGRELFSRLVEFEGRASAEARADWRRQQREAGTSRPRRQLDRPGCVTVYAAWLALSAVLGLCSLAFVSALPDMLVDPMLAAEAGLDPADLQPFTSLLMPLVIGWSLVSTGVQSALAAGLWFMKNWARIILIVLHSLGLLGALANVVLTFTTLNDLAPGGAGTAALPFGCVAFGAIALEAYIIFWFATNRWRFA
ncbi:MAG TPA: tetratricopeptide repeat protein [Anaerolineae bacterium]|nr:tetratricopeptide repeat protein [Anaerolineae bacterium]